MTGGSSDSVLPEASPAQTRAAAAQLDLPALGSGYSRFGQRIERRYPSYLALLPSGCPDRNAIAATLDTLLSEGLEFGAALRILRQIVLHRLLVLDCDQQAPMTEITRVMSDLAAFALDRSLVLAQQGLDELHGEPRGPDSQRARLWVVGMGKLGARELNVSSDIDLIYLYDHDGETAGNAQGRNRVSNHEYFGKVVRQVYNLIGDTTEHGFVFRVDLALRPNGNSGPPAMSLSALEEYFHVQGREWERFAWLKSRVVAPMTDVADSRAAQLRTAVLPFVFRRYLDYNVFDALRLLHRQIREQAARRSAGHPERANDVKLSRGGIREIEFIVQLLQVVRGGQFPELRTRATLDALPRLQRAGLMPAETVAGLAEAYVFLRKVEHRIQYLDDQQTHVLPTRDDDLGWMAASMGHPEVQGFLAELNRHRELVAQEFDSLLGGAQAPCKSCGPQAQLSEEPTSLEAVLPTLPDALAQRIATWSSHPRFLALRDESRSRLIKIIVRTAGWVRSGAVSEAAAIGLSDWIEPLLRRESYLALLLERPNVHERLLRMLGNARWPARYLLRHPGVIDELASHAMLVERFRPDDFEAELERRRESLRVTSEDDDESLLNLLRRAHHAEVFRTLARDVEGRLSVEEVADDLSALAQAILRVTTRWCWQRLRHRHRDEPSLAIIGYGKLGGKELGYGSDLDIVFVYDDAEDGAAEAYGALVRKLINWLTVKTGEGDLYEIDTALRPNGNSGLLVTTFEAFANYQQQRGSNTAWTWEHQAMTRARCVLASPDLERRFDQVRQVVVTAERDAQALLGEILVMRERVRLAHPVSEAQFDVKHSVGGMVDAEFAVQYMVLAHSARHPSLTENVGNIALLQRLERVGLIPAGCGTAAGDAYRHLRRAQHHARLNEQPTQVPSDQLNEQRTAIRSLWRAVFGQP